jgi:microcystin-dependent protein
MKAEGIRNVISDLFSGMIFPFAGSVIPDDFLYCDGSAVSRVRYATLFSKIGTTWGVGNGSTTFNLPDLRGAFLRGIGSHGSETMADGNPFAGPSVGSFENDQMQGHRHGGIRSSVNNVSVGTDVGSPASGSSLVNTSTDYIGDPISDGADGTPRQGDETRPFAAGIKYIIKI